MICVCAVILASIFFFFVGVGKRLVTHEKDLDACKLKSEIYTCDLIYKELKEHRKDEVLKFIKAFRDDAYYTLVEMVSGPDEAERRVKEK